MNQTEQVQPLKIDGLEDILAEKKEVKAKEHQKKLTAYHYCKNKGLSSYEVSKAMGVGESTIRRWSKEIEEERKKEGKDG